MARTHIPAWLSAGADVVVYSPYDDAAAVAEKFGVRAVHDYGELLETVDSIDICSPTPTHREYTVSAAAAGRHVVCEKPFALDPTDAREMASACADAGVQLYPGHVVRFFPEYAAMRAAVAGGAIGRVATLRLSRSGMFPFWSPWFADPAASGGIIADQMIHDLDIARWVAGPIERVFAVETATTAGAGPVHTAMVTLTHAHGALSHVHGVWGLPDTEFRTSFEICGDGGMLNHDSGGDRSLRFDLPDGQPGGDGSRPTVVTTRNPYEREITEFLAAFRGGPVPRVTAEDGVIAVEIAAAARESVRTGRAIEIPGV